MKTLFEVRESTRNEAKKLIESFHYLGDKGFRASKVYGLYNRHTDALVGVAVYHGVSVPETVVGAFGLARDEQEGIWELGRLVLLPEYNGGNYGSFLVGNSLKLLRREEYVRAVISYATSDRHVGYVYQATNWTYCGLTAKRKDFWVNGKIQERGKTKGVDGIWVGRPQRHRYIMVYDDSLELLWDVQEYPKVNTLDSDCYGCNGEGDVYNRGTKKTYSCPICTGEMKLMEVGKEEVNEVK